MSSPNKYYLYRHIRLDKNEPFYIGVGQKPKNYTSFEKEFRRAFEFKWNRTKHWKNIINKTKYQVEILLESNDYNFLLEKESEFIKMYGRKDLGTGTLVNMNDGGGGAKGFKYSKEQRERLSFIRKKQYLEGRLKGCFEKKTVFQYSKSGEFIKEWSCAAEAAEYYKVDKSSIGNSLLGRSKSSCGYQWSYEKKDFLEKIKERKNAKQSK